MSRDYFMDIRIKQELHERMMGDLNFLWRNRTTSARNHSPCFRVSGSGGRGGGVATPKKSNTDCVTSRV